MRYRTTFAVAAATTMFLVSPKVSEAAILYLTAEKKTAAIGESVTVSLKVDTDESSINATQATVSFDPGMISVEGIDKAGSTFNFWVEEPTASNDSGTVKFVGGTAKGVSGDSLQVLTLRVKATGAGTATLTIGDAAVTASDGKGTNVLSAVQGLEISVGGFQAAPAPPPATNVETPKAVVREAVPAKGLPVKPRIRVPLYPDETKWYALTGETTALWEVTNDVLQAALELTKNPNTDPAKVESELLTGKTFGALAEGIHYVHVQFRNNIGWGPIAHYKISIDRTAPTPFEIKMNETATENPTPTITYDVEDNLSGIAEATLFVDGKYLTAATSSPFQLPPMAPGKHVLLVRVADFAGNSIEDDIEFETLPLPVPNVHFIPKCVSQGEPIFISGRTLPQAEIIFAFRLKSGATVFEGKTVSDGIGNWEVLIDRVLPTETYALTFFARDVRGARSFPSDPLTIKIKPKTILSFGFLDLGWFEIFVLVVLIALAIGGSAGWYYAKEGRRRSAYETIASRDIDKFAALITKDLDELVGLEEEHDQTRKMKADFLIKKMQDTLVKMKKYVGEELGKVR